MKKSHYQKILADRIYKINKLTQTPYPTQQLLKEVGGDSRIFTILVELKATSYVKGGFTQWNNAIPVSQALLDSVMKRYYEKLKISEEKKQALTGVTKEPPTNPTKWKWNPNYQVKPKALHIHSNERKEFNLFWGLIKFRW